MGEDFVRDLESRYGPRLYKFALGLCNNDRARAEDLMQETLTNAWRRAAATRGQKASMPWLRTIMWHEWIDTARARWSRAVETGPEPLDWIPDGTSTEDRILDRWMVTQALAALRESHRKVIVLLYYGRCSVAETAEILGIPQGTVKSRTYYSLRAMKKKLEMQGAGSPWQPAQPAHAVGGSTSASTSSAPSNPPNTSAPSST